MPKILSEPMGRRIAFRLSEDEYQRLRRLSAVVNATSVSQMIRTAVQYWIQHGGGDGEGHLHQRIRDLDQQIAALSAQVNELTIVTRTDWRTRG